MSDAPRLSLVAHAGQLVGVALVVAVVGAWLPIPRSLNHDLPTLLRWLAALVGLALGAGALWLDRRHDLAGAWAGSPAWARVGVLVVVACVLFLIRPRLHWGDSIALVSSLDAGVHRWNPRWMTSMVALAYVFDLLRPLLSGALFLTLVYIALGCLELALLMATLRLVSGGQRIPCAAVLLVITSPATLYLMSGYLEIYAMPQLGIVSFLWAAAAFSASRRWMGFTPFGIVCGLAGLLYVGNLILLPLGAVLAAARLAADPASGWSERLRRGMGFGAGASLGIYASLCLVTGETSLGVRRMVVVVSSILSDSATVFQREATRSVWYAPFADALRAERAREFCETWSLYGVFGLLFLAMVAASLIVDPAPCVRALRPAGLFLPVLAVLVAAQLLASYVKTRPMGWWDWDLFTYAAYPVNLLAACLLLRLQHETGVATAGRTLSLCASVWCLMVYAYVNPVWPEWSGLPPRKRELAFESYWPMPRLPASEAEARGIRETSPFP